MPLGKRLLLPWANTAISMWFCDSQNHATSGILLSPFLSTGHHEMLAYMSALLIVIRTSLCCLQEAQWHSSDTDRVQQPITCWKKHKVTVWVTHIGPRVCSSVSLLPYCGLEMFVFLWYQYVRWKIHRFPATFQFNPLSARGKKAPYLSF